MGKPIRTKNAKVLWRGADGQEGDAQNYALGSGEHDPGWKSYIPGPVDFTMTIHRWFFGPLDVPPEGSDPDLN